MKREIKYYKGPELFIKKDIVKITVHFQAAPTQTHTLKQFTNTDIGIRTQDFHNSQPLELMAIPSLTFPKSHFKFKPPVVR